MTAGGTPTRTPLARYAAELESGALQPDPAQAALAELFDALHHALVRSGRQRRGVLARLSGLLGGEPAEAVTGLYVWGGVGRGKTHLMNAFHDSLPFDAKTRVHFHRFMLSIHAELDALRGRSDPVDEVAERLAERTRVLCFDEFHVSDITDAMLLGRLLEGLFTRGVTLVATSNVAPDDLYREGLQRARFLPAIALIERHTRVVEVEALMDYRLRALERAEIYHSPLDAGAETALASCFESLAPENTIEGEVLEINDRPVATRRTADGIAWFEFAELCETARSPADYIELARRYHTVLLSNVPVLDGGGQDPLVRFVHLVDELYERNVNLIVSAAAPPAALYGGERHAVAFARTRSRLEEMRSRDYLARKHLP